jgi:adenosylcobinamide-GDP ribazoletransferase
VGGLGTAVRYLTIIPVPGGGTARADDLGRAAGWFPVVGLGLGVVLVGLDRVASAIFPSLLATGVVVTAWKLLAGGLHLDGFADCLDGLSGRDRDDRLRIMRDSRIGALGAAGLVLILLLAVTALAGLPADLRYRAVLVAPTIGRAAPGVLARLFPPVGAEGQGAAFVRAVRPVAVATGAAFAFAIAALAAGGAGVAAWIGGLGLALATGRFVTARLGGLTGDAFGAAVEIAEVAVLLVMAAASHLGR